jgi:putative ABC transport system substrate-binding protein
VKRRDFFALFGGALSWPLAARAQQSSIPVIGFLGSASPELYADRLRTFRQGLKEEGYVEGQNVAIEYRWVEGQNDRLPTLAADLVRRQVAVLVAAGGTPSALAAKAATATIPIIFAVAVDPIEVGLVAGLNRPGGNMTGVTNMNVDMGSKRLDCCTNCCPRRASSACLSTRPAPLLVRTFCASCRPRPAPSG